MWAIFLLSAFGFAVAAMGLIWIGNKISNTMKCEDFNTEQKIKNNTDKHKEDNKI